MKRRRSQVLIDFTLIMILLPLFLVAIYLFSRMLHVKTTNSILNRQIAFNSTFKDGNHEEKDQSSWPKNEYYARFLHDDNTTASETLGYLPSFIAKIFNFFNGTRKFSSSATTDLEAQTSALFEIPNSEINLKEAFYIDTESFYQSSKLRLLLYSTALILAGSSPDTDISSMGSELFDSARNVIERENISFE